MGQTSSNNFLGDDYLLTTAVARRLYHRAATEAPIVDVHNHLCAHEIADDRRWETLTDLWLAEDHYKWRAMRLAGFPEVVVSGDADPWDRFAAWAQTVPRLIGNPLYTWTHLELQRAFGIDLVLTPDTAVEIWQEANNQLKTVSAQGLLKTFGVTVLATTDDPGDDLAAHRRHSTSPKREAETRIVPTLRPDAAHAMLVDASAWNEWAAKLSSAEAIAITDLASLLEALTGAHRRFAAHGARASDHGLTHLPDRPRDPVQANTVVRQAAAGRSATFDEAQLVMLEVVAHIASLAMDDDSVLQLHLGPLRNVSPVLRDVVGPDAGGDVMGDREQAAGLARFLGDLEASNNLPRTVLYNLNPADNATFATMTGAFTRPGVHSLVQWGPPWWFNDTEEGMRRQLDTLAQIGQLANFIGMLTDSRSILSMTRHELFRRVLCAKLGDDVESGRYPAAPAHLTWLEQVVRDISVDNTRRFFGFA